MDTWWLAVALVALTCLGLVEDVSGAAYKMRSDEEKLLEYLFRDYNPSARPVLNSSKTVSVHMNFSLLQIQELNVRSQVFTTTGLLILEWVDERLTWDNEITTLDELVIDAKNLWRPEFAVINGAEGIYGAYEHFQANIYPDGRVRWEPGGVFKTMCQIDITYYPFDEQVCDLVFGAWSYYTTKMNLTTLSNAIKRDTYETNGEWHIVNTAVKRNEFNFDCCPDQKFSNIAFSVHLRRRHTFYIMNVILPGILTSAVLLSIFFCTPSQKVHIGVAALLSFRLFLLNVADTIPRTSDHVPLLGIYLTCTMAITTMAMVATVFVLNLYGMKEKPVPLWAKRVFVVYLARFLCMCNCMSPQEHKVTEAEVRARANQHQQYLPVGTHHTAARPYDGKPNDQDQAETSSGTQAASNSHAYDNSHLHRRQGFIGGNQSPEGGSTPAAEHPPCERSQHPGELRRVKGKPDYNKDWVHVAAVCDRFFFWLCLIFITITTLLLFHPLTTSRYFRIPILEDRKHAT